MSPARRHPAPSRAGPYASPFLTPSQAPLGGAAGTADGFALQSPFRTPAVARTQIPAYSPQSSQNHPVYPIMQSLKPLQQDFGTPAKSTAFARDSELTFMRTPTPNNTPLRPHNLTPLNITKSTKTSRGVALDRLAPTNYATRTPRTDMHVDAHMQKETATMTKLRIKDLGDSDDEAWDDKRADSLFLGGQSEDALRSLRYKRSGLASDGPVSPEGHVPKRRMKSRQPTFNRDRSPSPSPQPTQTSKQTDLSRASRHQRQKSSTSSNDSNLASNRSSCARRSTFKRPNLPPKSQFKRVDSATLFFGPTIASPGRSGSPSPGWLPPAPQQEKEKFLSPHPPRQGYTGTDPGWKFPRNKSMVTPPSSPPSMVVEGEGVMTTDDDEDMMFDNSLQSNSSFSFSVIGTPSPQRDAPLPIPKKYKPRDSGVVLSDDEDYNRIFGDAPTTMPAASTSVNSIYSEEGLVTPGFDPTTGSGWPAAPPVIVNGTDDVPYIGDGGEVETFILKTLKGASRAPVESKRVPGTPVKKNKTTYLPGARPWQSAFAPKVKDINAGGPKGKPPRKSMPAAFPPPLRRRGADSDSDTDEDSPSNRKKYAGLGLGHPSVQDFKDGFPPRSRWLMRRSSSGAFSSGSDSMSVVATPTRSQAKDHQVPLPGFPCSPSHALKVSPSRSYSGSSSSSVQSPTTCRRAPASGLGRTSFGRPSLLSPDENIGRFERDFVEIDEVGSGEFGRVIKAQSKASRDGAVYAIKKSKRFEGMKHRSRLREEVEVLEHLSRSNGGEPHPNVLTFLDSWEEDDTLYIQTELCELGNFAHFLSEYGQMFPQLDESRVWKIIVDLSNGLQFIHGAGVIHLDIKPSNIFVTADGRFKIGDFGLASIWSLRAPGSASFEREGDKQYMAPEVLQGKYSKAADVFSLGMTVLEAAANIVVPGDGDGWHRLRQDDFVQVEVPTSPELFQLIKHMMRMEPTLRISTQGICTHSVVSRARVAMEKMLAAAQAEGSSLFAASPLASVTPEFLEDILGRPLTSADSMDLSL